MWIATHPTNPAVLCSGMLLGRGPAEWRNSYTDRKIYNSTVAEKKVLVKLPFCIKARHV